MSRLSSELAVERIGNRYDLILVASRRARELSRGDMPRVDPGQSNISTALLEIEARCCRSQLPLQKSRFSNHKPP
jgi:DNA-directed RNA polymerase subunit omega